MTRTILLIIYLFLILATNLQASSHFADNGCDGGTCGIYLFIYSLPFTICWLISLAGAILLLKKKTWSIILGLILCQASMLFASMLLGFGEEYRMSGLKNPVYILLAVNGFAIATCLFLIIRKQYLDWKNL